MYDADITQANKGTQETNHELFPSLPIGCSESLDGKHNYVRDDDTRIKMPGTNFKALSYRRKLGGVEYEYYNGLCACKDVKKMEIILDASTA